MFTPVEIIIALVVSTIGAALQGVIGFGFGVLSVPILTILNPELTMSGFLAKRFDDQVLRRFVLTTAGLESVGLTAKVMFG